MSAYLLFPAIISELIMILLILLFKFQFNFNNILIPWFFDNTFLVFLLQLKCKVFFFNLY